MWYLKLKNKKILLNAYSPKRVYWPYQNPQTSPNKPKNAQKDPLKAINKKSKKTEKQTELK